MPEGAIERIFTDYEKQANLILNQLDIVGEWIFASSQGNDAEQIEKLEFTLKNDLILALQLYSSDSLQFQKLKACYQIIIDLEHISNLAIRIIEHLIYIRNVEVYNDITDTFVKMMSLCIDMVRRSLLSFVNNDIELVNWTKNSRAGIDKYYRKILKKIAGKPIFRKDKEMIFDAIHIMKIAGSIERITDLAIDIAEVSLHSFERENIRDKQL